MFFEQEDAAFQAVNYLITQGHRDIACMTVPMIPHGQKPVCRDTAKPLKSMVSRGDPAKVKYGD